MPRWNVCQSHRLVSTYHCYSGNNKGVVIWFFGVLFFDAHSFNGFFYFWCFVWIYFRKPQDWIKTTLVWFFGGDRGVVEFPLIPWKVLNVVKVKYLISSIAVFSFISGAFSAFRKRFKTKMTIFGRFAADDVMRLKQWKKLPETSLKPEFWITGSSWPYADIIIWSFACLIKTLNTITTYARN